MGRSPGFGSTSTYCICALFRLAFAAAARLLRLTSHVKCNSPVRSTKSTPLPCSKFKVRNSMFEFSLSPAGCSNLEPPTSNFEHGAVTDCKRTVSGSVSLPSRGAFHLSLTVLVHYRSLRVFSLGRWSSLIPTGFHVPRGTWDALCYSWLFAYRAVTFCGRPFQAASTKLAIT